MGVCWGDLVPPARGRGEMLTFLSLCGVGWGAARVHGPAHKRPGGGLHVTATSPETGLHCGRHSGRWYMRQLCPLCPPTGLCSSPQTEAALLRATGQHCVLCSRGTQKAPRAETSVAGSKRPRGSGEGPVSLCRAWPVTGAWGGRAWEGDTSHVLAFHLGWWPGRSGQGSRGGGSWRAGLEAAGWASLRG